MNPMISYSFYNKFSRYIKRNLFRLFFSHKFKYFGKKASIIAPDIIEGEEYIALGNCASLNSNAWLMAIRQDNIDPKLIIEEGVTIGRFSHIVALRSITIRKNVLIADKVYISDNVHGYKDVYQPIMYQPIVFKNEVEIGENSWIGENVSIIGAKIGKHCIVGANSVVTKDISDYCIVVGIPAKVIKKYDLKTEQWVIV